MHGMMIARAPAALCPLNFAQVKGAVIVESFSLGVKAMAGLPGPYVHAFLRKIGARGLQKVASGFDEQVAVAEHHISFCAGPGTVPKVRVAAVGATRDDVGGASRVGFG